MKVRLDRPRAETVSAASGTLAALKNSSVKRGTRGGRSLFHPALLQCKLCIPNGQWVFPFGPRGEVFPEFV